MASFRRAAKGIGCLSCPCTKFWTGWVFITTFLLVVHPKRLGQGSTPRFTRSPYEPPHCWNFWVVTFPASSVFFVIVWSGSHPKSFSPWIPGGRALAASHCDLTAEASCSHVVSWYLAKDEDVEETLVVRSGSHRFIISWDQILDELWPELLVLALCSPGRFTISNVVEAMPSWKMETVVLADPYADDSRFSAHVAPKKDDEEWSLWADEFYGIPDVDWAHFQRAIRLVSQALKHTRRKKTWEFESLRLAARWYLRGRLVEHEWLRGDEYADILLRYVTCLENVLMLPGEKESIGDKLRSRTALMVGRNDGERREIYAFIKDVYDARSKRVHRGGKKKAKTVDLRRLRDVCRRAMACALIIAGNSVNGGPLDKFLRDLAVSRKSQDLAQDVAKQIGSLTRCF